MWSFFNGAGSNTMNDICGEEAPAPSPGIVSPAIIRCPFRARGEAARPGRGVMMVAGGRTTGTGGDGREVSHYPRYRDVL